MIQWKPFVFNSVHYDLTHLHPFEMIHKQEAKEDKPEKVYTFDVSFSLHCFTHKDLGDTEHKKLYYSDNRETRIFCFYRYELSKKLPEIIKNITSRKCYHTEHGNYFTVDIIDFHGNKTEYQVYFAVSKSGRRRGVLNLYVQSAYPNTKQNSHKKKKPIKFDFIAHNTLHDKKIKSPA